MDLGCYIRAMRPVVLLLLLASSRVAADDVEPTPPSAADETPADETPADAAELAPIPPPPLVPPPPTPTAPAPPTIAQPSPVPTQPWSPPRASPPLVLRRDRGETLWLPHLSWGFASTASPSGDGGVGSRVQLTFPVWITGERGDLVRVAPLVGYSWMRGHPGRDDEYDFASEVRLDSDVPYFHRHHALFGAAIRVGRNQIAWQTELFWSPGTFGSWDCGPHPEPDPDFTTHILCESTHGPTAASFRIDMGATVWNAFVGWTAEVAWRRGERARSIGIRLGTTFQ